MKITEMANLWVCHHEQENFNLLAVAEDEDQAKSIAMEYANHTCLAPLGWEAIPADEAGDDVCIDCDRVLTSSDYYPQPEEDPYDE